MMIDFVTRSRLFEPVAAHGSAVGRRIYEGKFAILHILNRARIDGRWLRGEGRALKIGTRRRRFDPDVGLPRCAHAAFRIADDPAHRVAGGDGARADKLLALLEWDIGDRSGRRIDLIERAFGEWIDLDRVDIAGASGLHPCHGVRLRHPNFGIGRFRRLLELQIDKLGEAQAVACDRRLIARRSG